jgi:methionyl-tRNA synthetase
MLERYRKGVVPQGPDTALDRAGLEAAARYAQTMDALLLHKGAAAAWDLVTEANVYVDRRAPWTQAKAKDEAGLDETLAALTRALERLAVLASPFLPEATARLWSALGLGPTLPPEKRAWDHIISSQVAGSLTTRIAPLFPKPEKGPGAVS